MSRRTLVRVALALLAVIVVLVIRNQVKVYLKREASRQEAEVKRETDRLWAVQRQQTFDELRPVALKNCRLERFGEKHDGGYLTCANLLGGVRAAYSYGISGYDQWGCDVSTRASVITHQYDCFNTSEPSCPTGRTRFHPECVAAGRKTEDGRPFDSIAAQMEKNGDAGRNIALKIDVEGAEWDVLAAIADETLARIDQLVIEFHDVPADRSLAVVRKLKRFFHVAHFHVNNFSCVEHLDPFPSWAFEVTFVNKRLDEVDPSRTPPLPHPLDMPNNSKIPDCRAPQFGGRAVPASDAR